MPSISSVFRCGLPVLLLASAPAWAQPSFDSGSTGVDGALNLTTAGTVIFDPRAFTPPLDPDGDGVYHFTTIHVASGVTVKFQADKAGPRPIIWLAQGDVTIAGTLDLNGPTGHHPDTPIAPIPAPGGFLGGFGTSITQPSSGGQGPGGGGGGTSNTGTTDAFAGGSGGGHLFASAAASNTTAGAAYGNLFLQPLLGGSGGGGGGFGIPTNRCRGGGGGGGGGALLLASSSRIVVSGSVQAKGGNGNSTVGICGGGGGSGGTLRLVATTLEGNGALTTAGGTGANGGGTPGSVGRIRLEALNHRFTGTTDINTGYSSPNAILPPAGGPRVRVVSVDGVAVPANPSGSYPLPDVTINKAGPVTFAIEAENVPVGTVVKLRLFSESHQTAVIDSTPLAGTLASSTATASVTLPTGVSRFTVEARWTP
ncbi:MAG: hypothetical protein SF066_19535 [Thermoanaerobaculia bacterium]|nr:hypothetical protein [Thermoanaerobaculia bacterium]